MHLNSTRQGRSAVVDGLDREEELVRAGVKVQSFEEVDGPRGLIDGKVTRLIPALTQLVADRI